MSGAHKTPNSRWDDAPVRDKHGRPKVAAVSERDISGILLPLARYRYLPADYLHAFTGGSSDYLINRLNLLSRRPNLYVARPHQQRANAGANHRRIIYELTAKGANVLQERGISDHRIRFPANFGHELMTCQVMASFELGTRETGARLIQLNDILNSENLPDTTRHSPKPYAIPITAIVHDQQINARVTADGLPFGVECSREGRRYYFFCPGIEADCGTEPVDTSDFVRSSIYKKFVLYLAIIEQGIYRSHFGFPNFYVPFITTNSARLASMMRLLHRVTNGAGSKNILFKIFPIFTSHDPPPPPSGHMLTADWQRVGYPPFNFLTS